MRCWTRLTRHAVLATAVLISSVACDRSSPLSPNMFRVATASPEIAEGGKATLLATQSGAIVEPTDIVWLSRDPTTATVKDGVATGVFPGETYILAMYGRALDSVRLRVRFAEGVTDAMGIRIAGSTERMRLRGIGRITEDTITAPGVVYTSILASSGNPDELTDCCRITGDTLLQLNFPDAPVVGTRTLLPSRIEIQSGTCGEILHSYGTEDVLFMIRESGTRFRFYTPVRDIMLDIVSIQLPTLEQPGAVVGRISFEAAAFVWITTGIGCESRMEPLGSKTVRVYAEFRTPLTRNIVYRPVPTPP